MSEPLTTPAIQTIVLLEQNKIQMGDPNGTFTINLPSPITLQTGESITLSKSFVDTSESDTDFITILPEDSEVVITSGLYYNDIEKNTAAGDRPPWGKWSTDISERPRGTTYILSNHSEVALHTFIEWGSTINPGVTGVADFIIELTTIDAAYLDSNPSLTGYLGKAHYVLTGKPLLDPAETGVNPTSTGAVIQQKFLLGGFMNMVTKNNKHQFYYYNRDTTPDQIDSETENHVAVFDVWEDNTGTILGWKASRNDATTYPIDAGQDPFGKWTFQNNTDGYNYFSDGGKPHAAQITTLRFPFSKSWSVTTPGPAGRYPGLQLNYITTPAVGKPTLTTIPYEFSKYPPSADKSWQGIVNLIDNLDNPPAPYVPSVFKPHRKLPEPFREKKHDWDHDWLWYEWTNWVDPLQGPTGKRCFPPFEFDMNNPPYLSTIHDNPANPGYPLFNAFLNPASQFAMIDPKTGIWMGNRCQPYQYDLAPNSVPTSIGCTFTPRQYKTKFTIPPGDYTYPDLAKYITDQLNQLKSPVTGLQNNPDDGNCPPNAAGFSNTYLLQDTYSLSMQYDGLSVTPVDKPPFYPNNYTFSAIDHLTRDAPDITTGVPGDIGPIPAVANDDPGVQPFWVSESGNELFQFDADSVFKGIATGSTAPAGEGPRVCGAENFSVIFDDTSSSFKILQAHTPIYLDGPVIDATAGTKAPGAAVIKQMGGAVDPNIGFFGQQLTIDTSSGAFLFDLEPKSLWFSKMGFNSSILTPIGLAGSVKNFTSGESQFATRTDLSQAKTFPMSLKTGVNRTGYYASVDLLIQKNATFSQIDAAGGQDIESSTPAGMNAIPLLGAGNDQAFYNIEMSGINNQEFTGQPHNNSLIQGLVGKYYSQGNFTQSESDGIQYIHKGETPIVIQSIRTRILDTQLNPETGLGPNSAFILTINKTK